MTHTDYTRKILNIKDENIYFQDKFINVEIIDTTYIVCLLFFLFHVQNPY